MVVSSFVIFLGTGPVTPFWFLFFALSHQIFHKIHVCIEKNKWDVRKVILPAFIWSPLQILQEKVIDVLWSKYTDS